MKFVNLKNFKILDSDSFSGADKNVQLDFLKNKAVVSLNLEQIVVSGNNKLHQNFLDLANVVLIADGISVSIPAKINKLAGIDLLEYLFSQTELERIAILGAKQSTLEKLKLNLEKVFGYEASSDLRYLGLNKKLVYCQNGFYKQSEEREMIDALIASEPELVIIAMGIPKQELLLARYPELYTDSRICLAVGGALDVLSGDKCRAPNIFIKLKMEWLYRLGSEPERIPKFLKNLISYLLWLIQN